MPVLSQLWVEFRASTDKFNSDLRAAQRESREFEKSLKPTQKALQDVGSTMTGVGVAMSAVGVPFAMAAKHAINTAEAFYDMGQRTGATTEALSSVSFMAEEAGASIGSVEMAFKRSSKVMEDAATGSKSAAESLAKLGLSVDDLMKMTPDQRFFAMAKGLDSIQDSSMKSAIAQEIYGKSGTELIPILSDLAKGQQSVIDTASKFGQVITTEASESANKFNDSLSQLAKSLGGVFNAMVDSGLVDTIASFANKMAVLIGEFTKAHPNIVAVGAVLGALAAVVGPLVAGLGLMVSGIAGLIPVGTSLLALVGGTAGLSAAFGSLVAVVTGPVGIVVGIIAATAAISKFVMNNETLVKILDPIWNAIGNAINSTVNLIIKLWDGMWKFIIEAPGRAKAAILGSVKSVTDGVTGFFKGMYEAVVGHSFVPDMLDRIGEEFGRLGDVMVRPAQTAARSVMDSFSNMLDGVIDRFTSKIPVIGGLVKKIAGNLAMSGLAKVLPKILGPGIAGSIGIGTASASAGVGAAGAGAGLGAAGSAMAAFATNPITIGIAAAIGAGLIAKHYIGQGRRAANEFVGNAERPFGQQLGAIVDSFDSMKKAGTLTLEQAKTARDSAQELWRSFLQSNAEFAAQGKTQAKVAEQSLENLKQAFGPNLQKVFEGMDSTIAGLQGAGASGSGIPATGLASSASTRFAAAVDRLVPAFDTLIETITGIGPRGGAQLTINNEFAPAFTFYGVPESLQQQIRDQIEPQIISDLQDNTRGITQQVKDALGL